jgi:uncharacterized protein
MNCPICKSPVTAREDPKSPNKFYPFCSDRCRMIDLGRWLGGKYQIPAEPTADDDAPPGEPRKTERPSN